MRSSTSVQSRSSPVLRAPSLQYHQGRGEGIDQRTSAFAAQHRRLPNHRASAGARIHLHRHDRVGRTEKPPSSWMPDQVINKIVERIENGDFCIIFPDNVSRPTSTTSGYYGLR